ncbi:membrane protein [Clostridium botulinum]|uniref:Membrane protein n=1 Tax=Clostridium botulinum TaxID=1491 RepID=A0A9Q1UWJ5_CLOBO|nr:membrane protein [Clostridium botulinum]AEB76415.1 membrane spanning protein [Clostridium botulinum BKT015925]KEI04882.1 membrane protein [Clostridium botulinum C/D str. Sp77]KLU75958.1 membrane protein [Clostridium botulinum V891]KOA75600.1 membrane protein [Clostridium botulinum]KOA76757.1 membrane protein [Clostridium botulinum]
MSEDSRAVSAEAIAAKKKLTRNFFRKGISLALFSGVSYGLYTAFLTMGMTKGVWNDWYGKNTAGLSAFIIAYLLAALGNAINDTCSAVWSLLYAIVKGKFGDFLRCINTKPGRIMIVAALIGGPIASTAYVVALQMAGSIVVPISALCPAIAAILGKVLYKQELNKRMAFGIGICVCASFLIGSTGFTGEASKGTLLGLLIAIIAALGWGFEGCVAGYGTALIDPEIGICIRQVTSGIANLFILLPILGKMAGGVNISVNLAVQAFTSSPAMAWFVLSGLLTFLTFMTWYAGNSMCGAGLGTACNGTYSFFGPLFCLLVLGVYGGMDGWSLPSVAWIGAIAMMIGILIVSMNPLDLFKKKTGVDIDEAA